MMIIVRVGFSFTIFKGKELFVPLRDLLRKFRNIQIYNFYFNYILIFFRILFRYFLWFLIAFKIFLLYLFNLMNFIIKMFILILIVDLCASRYVVKSWLCHN